MDKPKKRVRSQNFSYAEKRALLDIVEEHKHIINNKKTDHVTSSKKETAWKQITNSYNAQPLHPRSVVNLKNFYENHKRQARKRALTPSVVPKDYTSVAKLKLQAASIQLESLKAEREIKLKQHHLKLEILKVELEIHKSKLDFLKMSQDLIK